jgi:hypothetical protein
MAGSWNGNSVAYGGAGHWYVRLYVTDDGPKTGTTSAIRISNRVVFDQTISDSSNTINGSDAAGAWSANNFAFSGAGDYLVAQRDFETTISYGVNNLVRIYLYATGMATGGTGPSSLTIDYPMPARTPVVASAPGISVSSVTQNTAYVTVTAPGSNGGAGITAYEVYVDDDINLGSPASSWGGGSGTATNLLPSTLYYARTRALNAAGWSPWGTASFTTLAGSSVKVNNAWVNASPWVKVNGAWVRASAVWKKVNGAWVK